MSAPLVDPVPETVPETVPEPVPESTPTRIKRLKMRSMRRGIKEMDLILTAYSDRNLGRMDDAALDVYDALLNENDQDLYQWVTGQVAAPDPYGALIADIAQALQKHG